MDYTTGESVFARLDEITRSGSGEAAFEHLIDRLRRDKQYRQLFDARLMKTRHELGLPLLSQPAIANLPKHLQQPYQDGYVRAAREVGELLLADGEIGRAWPYFRAIGEQKAVAEALETFDMGEPGDPEAQELLNAMIQIAYHEGVNPRRGLHLILKHYGLCRAITMFGGYPQQHGREESLRLLIGTLHRELVDNLTREISRVEGPVPETESIPELIAGRDWLFANNAQYTDSSHIQPLLRLSAELDDEATLRQAVELAEYGMHLGPMFQPEEDPPFERVYEDRRVYLRALLGENVEDAVRHFEAKAEAFASEYPNRPAEVLVQLLVKLENYERAIEVFQRYLMDVPAEHLRSPALPQLCEMAGDFKQLERVAREQQDPVSYVAALLARSR